PRGRARLRAGAGAEVKAGAKVKAGARARARRAGDRPRVPEGSRVERVLELLERPRADARAQVLPAVVGDDEDHVALLELVLGANRDRGDGTRRDTDEQPLVGEQPLGPDHGVAVRDEDLSIQQRQVEDWRDVAVVE